MNSDKIMKAIGFIDEELIYDAKNYEKSKRFGSKKIIAFIAAALLCIIFSVSAVAMRPYYREIFKTAEQIIHQLKPVKKSCMDNGIKMEVISASVVDNEAIVYISMQDLEGGKIDESYDIFDSYSIKGNFDSYGYCEKIDYDFKTKTATFLLTIGRSDGKEMKDGKVTFSVGESISGKITYSDYIAGINFSKVELNPKTRRDVDVSCGGGIHFNNSDNSFMDYAESIEYLVPQGKLFSPFPGASITAMGYIDGKLHVQMLYENLSKTDCHGFVHFVDDNNNQRIDSLFGVYYWNEEGSYEVQKGLFGNEFIQYHDQYYEVVFDIPPEKLENCRMFGEFITHNNFIEGNWSVTFNIEDLY